MSGETVTIDLPEDHYTIFKATRDELPEIIVVNDALLTFRHTEIFPWHLRVRLDAKELAENGMPTPEESQLLFEVGDRIEDIVLGGRASSGARNALFLARSTTCEWSERITRQAIEKYNNDLRAPRPAVGRRAGHGLFRGDQGEIRANLEHS